MPPQIIRQPNWAHAPIDDHLPTIASDFAQNFGAVREWFNESRCNNGLKSLLALLSRDGNWTTSRELSDSSDADDNQQVKEYHMMTIDFMIPRICCRFVAFQMMMSILRVACVTFVGTEDWDYHNFSSISGVTNYRRCWDCVDYCLIKQLSNL